MTESRSIASMTDNKLLTDRKRAPAQFAWVWDRLELALLGTVLVVGLAVRLWYAQAIDFPPLDDPAYYVKVAQNILAGRGLTVDIIWDYFLPFASVTHPSNEFWMPLTSLVLCVFFRLFGVSFHVAQIPGVMAGALLPVMSYIYARLVFEEAGLSMPRRAAFTCGLLVALNALLSYQSAIADSTAPYAVLVLGALLVAGRRVGNASLGRHLLLGILLGLAYLTRSHAVFLMLAWGSVWTFSIWHRQVERRFIVGRGLITIAGAGLIIVPWLMRNYLAFGAFSSPSTYKGALLVDYVDFFNYATPVDLSTFLQHGPFAILASRWEGLSHNLTVQNLAMPPLAVIAWAGLFLLVIRSSQARLGLLYAALLYLGMSLIFTGPAITGSYWHSLGSAIPVMYVGLVYLLACPCRWLSRRQSWRYDFFEVLCLGLLVISVLQLLVVGSGTTRRHQKEAQQFGSIAAWLAEHPAPVVMTTQPSTLNYVTNVPAIMLPGNEQPDVVLEAARRYGARYLIITEQFGLYPRILEQQPDPRFVEVLRTEDARIYELRYLVP